METEKRWEMAQGYEKKHWLLVADRIVKGRSDLKWYQWKADRTLDRLRRAGFLLAKDAFVAEVGSGPVGQVGFLPASTRVAMDPLMKYFEEHHALLRERPKDVQYLSAKGEDLPLEDDRCDLVVIDNCLDHCEDPSAVLTEIRRILKPEGRLYLTLNVRPRAGWLVRLTAERMMHFDEGHPYSYHVSNLRGVVSGAGFREEASWLQSLPDSLRENWPYGKLRTMAKLGTLTLERLYEGVWTKTPIGRSERSRA